MTVSKMPLRSSNKWPKFYGFDIFGDNGCYVLTVAKGTVAYTSGLLPGDQILRLDGQDVSVSSAQVVKSLAKHSATQPPTLGVVSRLTNIELICSRDSTSFGFSVQGNKPVRVTKVEANSVAAKAGLKHDDVILEVNGDSVLKADEMRGYLNGRMRCLSLGVLPLGHVNSLNTPMNSAVNSTDDPGLSRVRKAKSLHDKMNEILGEDYEKKMAVVNVLKQYAEDRDVDMMARALAVILRTPQQMKIISQIRQFIPPRQRPRFDELYRHQYSILHPLDEITQLRGEQSTVKVHRVDGSFGFVIKGNNPVSMETVDPGGPADKAGLCPGDVILRLNGIDVRRCSHSHLVQLLQDSGPSPSLDILRPFADVRSASSVSMSSTSSQASSEWMKASGQVITDKDGKSFRQRVEYLLTSKERSQMRKAMLQYDSSRNIAEFFNKVSHILDTPSKQLLWKFIVVKLPESHQEFCLNRINLSRDILLDMRTGDSRASISPSQRTPTRRSQNPHMTSFQQQVDYLLTSKERTQLKKALQIYSKNRKVDNLIEDMEVILDTPSKGTLWMYIVPLLITEHQDYARERLHLDSRSPTGYPMDSYIGSPDTTPRHGSDYYGKEDDFHLVGIAANALRNSQSKGYMSSFSSDEESQKYTQRSGVRRARGRLWKKMHPGYGMKYSHDDMELSWKRGQGQGKSYDMALMKELEETRKVVEEAKKLFQSGNRNAEEPDSEDESHLSTKYVTVIPIGQRVTPESIPGSDKRRMSLLNGHSQSKSLPNGLNAPPEIIFTSESDSEVEMNEGRYPLSIKSGDSFNTRALTALKELDAAMAAEVSDIENGSTQISSLIGKSQIIQQASQSDTVKENKMGFTDVIPMAPVAPPPPPPVPPPAPEITPPTPAKMNVKRINWEKLDQRRVGNTIWEQLGDEDLDDVVRYLELEQHFSTQVNRTKIADKKNEVYILDPKKAYNLCYMNNFMVMMEGHFENVLQIWQALQGRGDAILLGHLRLSVDQMKEALYLMDEEVLTPDVLKQLLAFAPSSVEMDKFESFSGDAEDFSKPDKFVFEMSRIPGYEQRLKAMLFKENFNEKVNEMKENLQNIRKASKELRNSKKLAKLLELILAMGNYMNKGNQRVGEAAGFKISFLNQLDITKTKDNKSTFLNVLADAVYNKFPSVLTVGEELPTVMSAGKVSDVMLNQELQDLRKVLQDISNTLDKFGSQKSSIGSNDRFQDVMGHFISQASDEIQGLFRLQANTMEDFQSMTLYFGEDTKKATSSEIFGIFSDFVTKFEAAHRHNMMYKRH